MRFLIAVPVLVLLALPVHASASVTETVRQYIRLTYEGHFGEATPKTQAFERRVRNLLRTRCVEVEDIAVRGTSVSGDVVQATVEVSIVKTERDRKEPWVASELIPLRVSLVREKDAWAVTAVESLDEETAAQLLAAGAGDEALRGIPPARLAGVARAMYERGLALLNGGKFADAERVAAVAQRLAQLADDRGAEALSLGVMMFTALDRDRQKGVRLSRESLALAESVGDPDVLARAWYNRGRSMADTRMDAQVEEAQAEAFHRAIAFAERAEDPTLLIRVLYSMANAATNDRDHLTARQHVDRFLPLAREIGDVSGELAGESILSLIYFEQGDVERGFYHNTRAARLAKERNAYAYISLVLRAGWVLTELYRYDEARAMFARVLQRGPQGQLVATANIPGSHLATTLMCLATMAANEGDFNEGACLLREAARVMAVSEASLAHNLANAYLKHGNYPAAQAVSLISLAEPNLFPEEQIAALRAAAASYRALGAHDLAASAIEEAIEVREEVNTRIAGDERQRARGSDRAARLYHLAAGIALDGGRAEEALMHLERGRARVLRQVLENGRPDLPVAGEAAERQRHEREVARLTIELDRARATGHADSIRQAKERLDRARADSATFLDGLRARAERRSLDPASPGRAGFSEALQRLPPGITALSYLAGDRELHVFLARSGAPVVHRKVDIGRDALAERVQRLVDALSRRDDGFDGVAVDVYRLLIAPVEQDLGQSRGVVIVPDGPLWRVPFAALLDGRRRFLIERLPIVYAPSIVAYTMMSREGSRAKPVSFLGIGNPAMDKAMQTAFVSLYRNAALGALPDAEREVQQARALYRRSVVLTGGEADEGRVKQAMREADVVHLATHGLLDDSNPMYSRLAVARDAQGREDGWLEAWEIMLLPLDADLVVLSACETATGSIGAGEGVVGMTWAFFVAGARATVSTQWKVSSRGSADLMIAFHESLRTRAAGPLRKADALREAQLRMMRVPRYRHPFYWGAFVMLGDAS